MNKIVVSATRLKQIVALAEQNALENPDLSPLVELIMTARMGEGHSDVVQAFQLPYSFHDAKVLLK